MFRSIINYTISLFLIFQLLINIGNITFVVEADHDLGHDTLGDLGISGFPFKIKEVVGGLKLPTQMAFLGQGDILVVEKNNGTVRRVMNGNLLNEALLDVNVAKDGEKGMLGIAVAKNHSETYVFLYFTESEKMDGGTVIGNVIYRYELHDNKLTKPKLLLRLPAAPGLYHYGGVLSIGPDALLYASIGDLEGSCENDPKITCPHFTMAQNNPNGKQPDGRAGILRITQNGKVPPPVITNNNTFPSNLYYAYGIRNSFGIDFDPVTGNLWDTENGPEYGDEINLVNPGFNSGWSAVHGIWKPKGAERDGLALNPQGLVDFGGKGIYRQPEFIWNHTVGPSAIKFLNSNNYGKIFKNDMFVADSNNGRIYHFKLNSTRTGLLLKGALIDKIADNEHELENVIFAHGFGIITDMEVAPDGYLYILTYGSGKIFRVIPKDYSS